MRSATRSGFRVAVIDWAGVKNRNNGLLSIGQSVAFATDDLPPASNRRATRIVRREKLAMAQLGGSDRQLV
jgi:hypothetical protein